MSQMEQEFQEMFARAKDRGFLTFQQVDAVLPDEAGDPRWMDDIVIRLDDAGLDGSALVAAAQDPGVKQGLMDATQAVVGRGAFGLPTFFLGDDMYFGKDRVHVVESRLRG